ncbi:uncharacterized protein DUF1573 [Flavobacteriaceae bacterium MAR_2010_72]|nr:uncharacterized protein DUF1573 [Flavobacteriaceae bacterium MAR_2010_72]TVZ58830.1 uncharacterized protein DUF1573 [Flavobacteriaceae bacterium MAR_2010_105]
MNFTMNTFKTKPNTSIYKLLFVICLFMSSISFAQNAKATEKAGVLSFETEEIDYGTINQNDNGVKTFKFTNTGAAPIVITHVKTSCGCTVPTYSKTPILAGETGEIEIKYDTNRIGAFTKTITIVSNASEPSKIIKIKGNIHKKDM